jgi:hypothetical protein
MFFLVFSAVSASSAGGDRRHPASTRALPITLRLSAPPRLSDTLLTPLVTAFQAVAKQNFTNWQPFVTRWRMKSTIAGQAHGCDNGAALMQFAVGFKLQGTTGHVVVNAEDALIAALKIKAQRPEALIMYVRRQNKRGDTRHPAHGFAKQR